MATTADDRRGEPATALRYEPVTNWHERGQYPQPTDEHEHEQASDRQFARSIQPPANARGVAGRPLSCVPHVCPACLKAGDWALASICPMPIPRAGERRAWVVQDAVGEHALRVGDQRRLVAVRDRPLVLLREPRREQSP